MLKNKIDADFKHALKGKRETELSILRLLKSDILNREKEKRYNLKREKPDLNEKDLEKDSVLTDDEVLELVFSKIKKGKESVLSFEKGNRQDLVEKEKKEIEVLKKYLPEQLSEEEIEKMCKEAVEKTEAESIKDMGKVMAELMPKIKGKADASQVSKTIKEILSKHDRD